MVGVRVGRSGVLCGWFHRCHLAPHLKSFLHEDTILPGFETMSPWLEMPRDGAKGRKKALCVPG
jgi:hypothetical protein